jgi:hypothetical protein
MKWMSTIFLFLCLSACFRHEERQLSGPTLLDFSGAILKSNASLRNVENARILVVIERDNPKLQGAPSDSCGFPSLVLSADVVMGDGRRFVFSGHDARPCNAAATPITEMIELRNEGPESLPKDTIRSIKLRSAKPVTLQSVEWQTWEQGP